MNRVRGLIRNTGFSLTLNVTQRAAGALTFIAIGRFSRVQDAGTFALALGYLAILTTLFTTLDDILVKESASQPGQTRPLLFTYGAIRIGISVIAWLALVLILLALNLYPPRDRVVLTIITSCVLIDAFAALGQSVLHAHGRFGWPTVAAMAGSAAKLGGALLALAGRQGLEVVVLAWPLGSIVTVMIMVSALRRHLRRLSGSGEFRFDRGIARHLTGLIPDFSATSILAGLEFQLDVVLLSILLSTEDVAIYSAAVQIMMFVQMIAQAYRMVLYPALVRAFVERPWALRRLIGRSLLVMAGLALLAAASVTLIAPSLVTLLYGERFAPVAPILQVLIWNLLFFFLDVSLVRFMMAADGQAVVWQTLVVSLTTNVMVNLVLIPRAGTMGAAYARLCSSAVFCGLIGWQVFRRLNRERFVLGLPRD